jgi:hypothetical protein
LRQNERIAITGAKTVSVAASFGLQGSSILVCHLPKSAKQMLIVEFADLEIGSAAERYRTSMAKYLPKPLRTLYRGGRARAVNGFTSSNAATIIEIKRQCHEKSDCGHTFVLCKFPSSALRGGIASIGEMHQGSLLLRLILRRMRPRPLVVEHRAQIAHVENPPWIGSEIEPWPAWASASADRR